MAPPAPLSLTANPLSLDFGLVAQGGTSAAMTAEIINDGAAPQTLGTLTVGDGFALAVDGCSGQVLAVNQACSIDVTFTPPSMAATVRVR
ncbi:hypothetical protein GCM10007052_27380 [Halioglobus japonicus]|nr:hypothetical protein [Halioglobus japonicus]GHD19203.1 hypothetical protein GCM10007052_27380 [Halioglobus japonicus]